jgi:hypothetical protein
MHVQNTGPGATLALGHGRCISTPKLSARVRLRRPADAEMVATLELSIYVGGNLRGPTHFFRRGWFLWYTRFLWWISSRMHRFL